MSSFEPFSPFGWVWKLGVNSVQNGRCLCVSFMLLFMLTLTWLQLPIPCWPVMLDPMVDSYICEHRGPMYLSLVKVEGVYTLRLKWAIHTSKTKQAFLLFLSYQFLLENVTYLKSLLLPEEKIVAGGGGQVIVFSSRHNVYQEESFSILNLWRCQP